MGWSLFRQEHYEQALVPFFALLDRQLPAGAAPEDRIADLAPAEQEQLTDVFRAISLSFSYLEGAGSIDAWFRRAGPRDYEERIYRNLAELFLFGEEDDDTVATTNSAVTVLHSNTTSSRRLGTGKAIGKEVLRFPGRWRSARVKIWLA